MSNLSSKQIILTYTGVQLSQFTDTKTFCQKKITDAETL